MMHRRQLLVQPIGVDIVRRCRNSHFPYTVIRVSDLIGQYLQPAYKRPITPVLFREITIAQDSDFFVHKSIRFQAMHKAADPINPMLLMQIAICLIRRQHFPHGHSTNH